MAAPLLLRKHASAIIALLGVLLTALATWLVNEGEFDLLDEIPTIVLGVLTTIVASVGASLWRHAFIAIRRTYWELHSLHRNAIGEIRRSERNRRAQLNRMVKTFETLSEVASLIDKGPHHDRAGIFDDYVQLECESIRTSLSRITTGQYTLHVRPTRELARQAIRPLATILKKGSAWRTATRLDFWAEMNMGTDPHFRNAQADALKERGSITRVVLLPRSMMEQGSDWGEHNKVLAELVGFHMDLWGMTELPREDCSLRIMFLTWDDAKDPEDKVANFALLDLGFEEGAKEEGAKMRVAVRMLYPEGSFCRPRLVPFDNICVTEESSVRPSDAGSWRWTYEECEERFQRFANYELSGFALANDQVRERFPCESGFWENVLIREL